MQKLLFELILARNVRATLRINRILRWKEKKPAERIRELAQLSLPLKDPFPWDSVSDQAA